MNCSKIGLQHVQLYMGKNGKIAIKGPILTHILLGLDPLGGVKLLGDQIAWTSNLLTPNNSIATIKQNKDMAEHKLQAVIARGHQKQSNKDDMSG